MALRQVSSMVRSGLASLGMSPTALHQTFHQRVRVPCYKNMLFLPTRGVRLTEELLPGTGQGQGFPDIEPKLLV
jgi:hypothetical protein